MKISIARLKLIGVLLAFCVTPASVFSEGIAARLGDFFKRVREKTVIMLTKNMGFKDALLNYMSNYRLQYPEWSNKSVKFTTPGVDFTFIEYSHRSSPSSSYLHDILNRTVHLLEEEWHSNSGFQNNSSELECLFDYNNHYLLLTGIANAIEAKRIVEIGTASGSSLWSWLRSEHVRMVDTWDIVPINENTGWFHNDTHRAVVEEMLLKNNSRWSQYVENLLDPDIWTSRSNLFSNADIIFIDGPHNGAFEKEIFRKILTLKNDHPILLIFDDIWVSSMVNFWKEISLPKLDATAVGHQSGTGLVMLTPHQERNSINEECNL